MHELRHYEWVLVRRSYKGPGECGEAVFEETGDGEVDADADFAICGAESFSQSSEKNGDDEFSGTHLLDKARQDSRAKQDVVGRRMW